MTDAELLPSTLIMTHDHVLQANIISHLPSGRQEVIYCSYYILQNSITGTNSIGTYTSRTAVSEPRVNTRNKNHLHTPTANFSCFQKGAYYAGIRIFKSLPPSLKTISDKKEKFKVALKRYLNTHTFYSVDEFLQFKKDS
jgi:hypothetical protein